MKKLTIFIRKYEHDCSPYYAHTRRCFQSTSGFILSMMKSMGLVHIVFMKIIGSQYIVTGRASYVGSYIIITYQNKDQPLDDY